MEAPRRLDDNPETVDMSSSEVREEAMDDAYPFRRSVQSEPLPSILPSFAARGDPIPKAVPPGSSGAKPIQAAVQSGWVINH